MSKFSTYSITFRPRNGVDDDQIKRFDKWVRKQSIHYHVVTEKQDDKRHIHAAVVLNRPLTRSNVSTALSRLYPSLDSSEKRHAWCLKVWYNNDWLSEYLDKDDDTVVVCSCLPEIGHLESFYPPKEDVSTRTARCSVYYHRLESLWYEHQATEVAVNTVNVRHFLFRMMYSLRVIDVIRDDKGIIQVARHLTRFLNKTEESTIELAPFETEE